MADIKITELHPAGSNLFHDSESFLDDLREDEIGTIRGGYSREQYELILNILHRLTIASNIELTNGINYNTIGRTFGNTIGQSVNTISNGFNSNTISGINSLPI